MQNLKIKLNDDYELLSFSQIINSESIQSNYYNWSQDEIVTLNNTHGLFPKSNKDIESFFKDVEDNKILCFAIVDIKEQIHIGNVSLQRIDWINRSAELAIIIGDPSYYGKGIGTIACKKVIEHAFGKLNLIRIWSGTASTNIGMQKIFKKLCFEHEGTFKKSMFLNGKYVDVFEYGLLKNETK